MTVEHFIEFAVVTVAILASMGLAMWMEWFCLRWLMRLMPGTSLAAAAQDGSAMDAAKSAVDEALADEAALVEESAKAA